MQLFHLVCRIAETLLKLQHAGHTKYISWSLSFTCSTTSIDELKDQAISMEKELSDTLDLINEQRHCFHALNYFTTQQVLQIRHNLGSLKFDKTASVTPQLLSLLATFSLQITVDDIKNIVEEVCVLFNEQEAISKEEENEIEEGDTQSLTISAEDKDTHEGETQEERQSVTDNLAEKEHKSLNDLIRELTGDEEEIFVQLHDLGYAKIVCYKAVQHAFSSSENANSDDALDAAMEWCFDNANQYNQNDASNINFDDSSVSNYGINNEEMICDQSEPLQPERAVSEENINISHPVVQELLSLGFTPELSLKGAKLFNGNFEQASEWCLNAETGNNETEQPLFGSIDSNVSMLSSEEAVEPIR